LIEFQNEDAEKKVSWRGQREEFKVGKTGGKLLMAGKGYARTYTRESVKKRGKGGGRHKNSVSGRGNSGGKFLMSGVKGSLSTISILNEGEPSRLCSKVRGTKSWLKADGGLTKRTGGHGEHKKRWRGELASPTSILQKKPI